MMDTFVLTGSRPPSATGSRHSSEGRPRSGYRKLRDSSEVDESLFSSSNFVKMKQNHPSLSHKSLTPKEKKRAPPLLWSPSVTDQKPDNYFKSPKNLHTGSDSQKYRLRKHTPTFVDETLFGPKLQEPSFPAPWEDKKRNARPFNWSPPEMTCTTNREMTQHQNEMEPFGIDGRPPSRQGRRPASTRTRPCTVESVSSTKSVWRP